MISVSLEEQETTINYCRTENTIDIWTSDRTVMTKLDKLCETAPDNYKLIKENRAMIDHETILSKEYQITDKTLLSFRPKKRSLSDEQKTTLANRLNGAI